MLHNLETYLFLPMEHLILLIIFLINRLQLFESLVFLHYISLSSKNLYYSSFHYPYIVKFLTLLKSMQYIYDKLNAVIYDFNSSIPMSSSVHYFKGTSVYSN